MAKRKPIFLVKAWTILWRASTITDSHFICVSFYPTGDNGVYAAKPLSGGTQDWISIDELPSHVPAFDHFRGSTFFPITTVLILLDP